MFLILRPILYGRFLLKLLEEATQTGMQQPQIPDHGHQFVELADVHAQQARDSIHVRLPAVGFPGQFHFELVGDRRVIPDRRVFFSQTLAS